MEAEVVDSLHQPRARRQRALHNHTGGGVRVIELGQDTVDRRPVVHYVDRDSAVELVERQLPDLPEGNGDHDDVGAGSDICGVDRDRLLINDARRSIVGEYPAGHRCGRDNESCRQQQEKVR